MKYEELYNDFIKLFPDDISFFEKLKKKTGADVSDGMHVVFGMIIVPYIKKIVLESPDKANKAFGFFEDMEKSEDPKIAEVLEFTVLENILTEDKDMIPQYALYFGPETKEAAKAVSKWFR